MIEYLPVHYLDEDGNVRKLKAEVKWEYRENDRITGHFTIKNHANQVIFNGLHCVAFVGSVFKEPLYGPRGWDYELRANHHGTTIERGHAKTKQDLYDISHFHMIYHMMKVSQERSQ